MLFSSITFLYYFLPIVLLTYFLVPKKAKNIVLLSSSLLFYFWGEPKYIFLMIVSILEGYIFGLLIEKYKNTKYSKVFLILSIIIGLSFLCFFKYTDFFINNINNIAKTNIPLLNLLLPIGISFYTFQVLSYTVDVYRGDTKAQKNIISFATYVALFPQLIAGPIVRYVDIEKDLKFRTNSVNNIYDGVKRFIYGLSKKVLIANLLGELTEIFKESNEKSVLFYWIYAVSFTLHIYFDFSGYSDMAIGLGKIFGFKFPENFNFPYISKSITEFWRRWHMSLGSWFRDYVYIPLGGNRVKKFRWFINIFVVWMLTGFWHGANWTFIVWGLFFAFLLIIEKLFLLKILKKIPSFFSHIYVLFMVVISFVIFNATSLREAFNYISCMFFGINIPLSNSITFYYLKSYLVIIIIGILFSTPLIKMLLKKAKEIKAFNKISKISEPLLLIFLLITITAFLVDGSFNPFLYFRF